MRAYRCNDCGEIFDMPKIRKECMGEFWGFPAYESFGYCPCCDSDDFEEYDESEEEDEDEEAEYERWEAER